MRARPVSLVGLLASMFTVACGATPASSGTTGAGGASAGGAGGMAATTGSGGAGGVGNTTGSMTTGSMTTGSMTTGAGGATSTGTGSGGSGGCAPGTGDCDGNTANGCETDTNKDPNHCGNCMTVCGPANGPACMNGMCGLQCAMGTGDCDGNIGNGCETDTNNDSAHCGNCKTDCMGAPCVQGACACAAETQQAKAVQLDLFIMLDQSGSMSDSVTGGTKWSTVTTALNAFFSDPQNAGLGVGIQYFALPSGGGGNCPPICFADADCGANGPCLLFQCLGCGGAGSDSCTVSDYSKAEVEIAPLSPAQATALSNSVAAHSPSTNTPTAPALQGAIAHSKAWAASHPSHTVVAVFATDGDPTECNPQDIPSIAALAAAGVNGNPSIKTFVIGVGPSLGSLNAIAASGGTMQAFIVDTNANVVQQFEMALKTIQQSALGCQYNLPQPAMGMLDFNKINVQYTPGNGPLQVLPNVPDKAGCNPGGWYYDNNANPTKIILCDATCTTVENDPGAKIDILLGCATQHM